MDFFRVRNLEKFQHYKERSPPWVKLHQTFLDDYLLCQLGDSGRFHFAAIILLASRTGNVLPFDENWLKVKMVSEQVPDLQRMLAFGFIELCEHDASKMLASCSTTNEVALERVEKRRGEDIHQNPVEEDFGKPRPPREKRGFVAPSLDEVMEYGKSERLGSVKAVEAFHDHFTANGWKVGKNPMRDWRAAYRNWVRRESEFSRPTKNNGRDLIARALEEEAREEERGTRVGQGALLGIPFLEA